MMCGAGGGGFLQVIMKRNVTIGQIKERLAEVFEDSGVNVWQCSFFVDG
jgi:fucokinase